MNEQPGAVRRLLSGQLVRFLALAMILVLYGFTRLPSLPQDERKELASRFAFSKTQIPAPPGDLRRTVRPVHPSMEHIAGWISAVGAGVALNDLDGDGLNNDLCNVDTRVDRVQVAPVPGTGARYAPFTLDPDPALPHDRRTMAPMGCVPGDWNEDGRMDALVYYWGRPPVLFMRRDSQGMSPAAYRAQPLAPVEQVWNTNALTSADVDGDGHLDLIVGNYFPDGARILDAQGTGTEHMHKSMSRSENGGINRLYLGAGSISQTASGPEPTAVFREAPDAFDPKTAASWTLAAGAADLDGDLLPEIYFGNDFGNDRLLFNRSTPGHPRFEALIGHKGFTTPTSKVLGRDSFKGMGVDFGDLNGDGRLDIYVSNIAQNWALEESHFVWVANGGRKEMERGVAPFEDQGEALGMSRSGWGWDSRFADFDGDGVPEAVQAIGFLRGTKNRWPELHELAMGNDNHMVSTSAWHRFKEGDDLSGHLHNPFFVRASDGRYYDVAPEVGIGQSHVTRGIALADVDGDGDLDFAIANQWETSWFFRNDSPRTNTSLVLDLRLPNANGTSRPAIGAEVTLQRPDGKRMVAQVDGGNGHSGKRAPEVYLGLGRTAPETVLPVDVKWRDGSGKVRQQRFQLKPGDHTLVLGDSATVATVAASPATPAKGKAV